MCECVRVAFLVEQRPGVVVFFRLNFMESAFIEVAVNQFVVEKVFGFSLYLSLLSEHIYNMRAARCHNGKHFWTTSSTYCRAKNDIMFRMWKDFFFICDRHLVRSTSSTSALKMLWFSKNQFRSHTCIEIEREEKWSGSKKQSRDFPWHLARIRDDMIELRIRPREKLLNVIPINICWIEQEDAWT